MPNDRGSLVHGLDRSYFLSNDIFKLETERIFCRNWLCVGRAENFGTKAVATFRTLNIGRYGLLVIRRADGTFAAYHNVCRHRGTRLLDSTHGEIVDACIKCPYHAWSYDVKGCLNDAPNMHDAPEFDPHDFGLMKIGCVNWGGFIMLNLNQSDDDFEADLKPIIHRVANWTFDQLSLIHTISYEVNANWKLLFQNYNECSHFPTAHPILNRITPFTSAKNDLTEGPILGGPMDLAEDFETVSVDGKFVGKVFPGLSDRQRRSIFYYTVFPSLFISLHPDYVIVDQIERLSTERSTCKSYYLASPETHPADLERAIEQWREIYELDWRICQLNQKGIESPAYKPGPYSSREAMLMAFDRHYRVSMIEPGETIHVNSRRPTDIPVSSDPTVTHALRFIREEFVHGIDVQDIAKAVDVSKRSLEIKFKQVLGRSPSADLELVRIANAKELLANSELPIAEIAKQCGYRSVQTFSTVFRRLVDMTPTDYRGQFIAS